MAQIAQQALSAVTGKKKAGILGATGTVGQRFILFLHNHPLFTIHALGASSRSAGQKYGKVTKWKQVQYIPDGIADVVVKACTVEEFKDCDVVFSGLDSDVAGDIESAFRAADLVVFSNAKNFRTDPSVPLIVPYVNPSHFSLIPHQRSLHTPPLKRGYIITNANCAATGLVVPLHALEKAFGPIDVVLGTTLQAISGAGYPGVPSLDIFDNVVPYISGEEDKLEWEVSKILSEVNSTKTEFLLRPPPSRPDRPEIQHEGVGSETGPPISISVACNRVPVLEGHTVCASIRFARRPPPSPQQCIEALRAFTVPKELEGAPSAPKNPIWVHEEADRPQPRLDRDRLRGTGINVGRVRECGVLDIKFVVLSNNVAIGAAASSVLNAEAAVKMGLI